MASYLQKLRRQSKQPAQQPAQQPAPQPAPQSNPPPPAQADARGTNPSAPEPLKTVEAPMPEKATAGPSDPTLFPPVPTVAEPSDEPADEAVLDEEDQKFLERLAAIADEPEGQAPALPKRPIQPIDSSAEKTADRGAQEALMDGAHQIALPMSPPEGAAESSNQEKGKGKAKDTGLGRRKSVLSYFSMPKFSKKDGDKEKDKTTKSKKRASLTTKDRDQLADDLQSAAVVAKTAELSEAQKEDKELTDILDQLNLSAMNNRVFSFSKESEELLGKFTQVLKDIVNGAPTAYNDLEALFTDYDNQLKKMYGTLPPFLQNLIKSLPAKLTATLAPEMLAATAEKPGFDAKQAAAGSAFKKAKLPTVPSLKSLIASQGAISTALRSIVNFLKFRFPMLATGTNLIMSLAVFVLLFVLWYCHKRGREVRLENERLAASSADIGGASGASSINEDADSIFGDKAKMKAKEGEKEIAKSPAAISDGNEASATVQDLPSVSHLPDPQAEQVAKPAPVPVPAQGST